MQNIIGHRGRVHGLAFSPDGSQLASVGGRGRSISLWNLSTCKRGGFLTGHENAVRGISFGSEGFLLVSRDSLGAFLLWDTRTGEQLRVAGKLERYLAHVAFAPGSMLLVATTQLYPAIRCHCFRAVSGDGGVVLEPAGELGASGTSLAYLVGAALAPEAARVALASKVPQHRDTHVLLLARGRSGEWSFPVPGSVHGMAFSPSGTRLAVAVGTDIYLRDTATLEPQGRLRGHGRMVTGLGFTPDGRHLLSASTDGTVRVWDAPAGKELHALDWRLGPLYSLALSADGMRAAAGGSRQLIVWDLDF